jgi:hypothetical protein
VAYSLIRRRLIKSFWGSLSAAPFLNQRLGTFVTTTTGDELVRSCVPPPLPPHPPLELAALQLLLEEANQSLGRLDGLASVLPDLSLFIYAYVRKEAVLSSQIEGTQSSLSDLLLFESDEAPGVPIEDVREVSNYVAALNHGLERLRGGFPLSLRLIREIHAVLLAKGRGKLLKRWPTCRSWEFCERSPGSGGDVCLSMKPTWRF